MLRDRRPLYVRLADEIVRDFSSRGQETETRLPPEIAVAERYQVSRATVREAFRLLERDGVISSRHGIGTFFVSGGAKFTYTADVLTGFSTAVKGQGIETSTTLLSCEEVQPTPKQVREFGWGEGSVVRLERLRFVGKDAFAYSVDNAPLSYLGDTIDRDSLSESFFGVLEKNGHKPCHAVSTLRAIRATVSLAKQVPSWKGRAITVSEELVYDRTDRVIASSVDYLDTRLFNLTIRRRVT